MQELFSKEDIVNFSKALSSELRVNLLQYIAAHPGASFPELSEQFHVSRVAITQNTRILQDAGLIDLRHNTGKGDARKACYLKENRYTINFTSHFATQNNYAAEIPIGQYTDYSATPTCGIATTGELIGREDDPRYFDDPKRFQAGILWFTTGHIEYRLPNYLQEGQRPVEIQLSFEISSEAPGIAENWPSDLTFYFNDKALGTWTSPGDYGEKRGLFTPEWWPPNWNQYGLLKLLSINRHGTFIDGLMISPCSLGDLALNPESDFRFRIAAPADAKNVGGFTLFGHGFGNYDQDIRLHVIYETVPADEQSETMCP